MRTAASCSGASVRPWRSASQPNAASQSTAAEDRAPRGSASPTPWSACRREASPDSARANGASATRAARRPRRRVAATASPLVQQDRRGPPRSRGAARPPAASAAGSVRSDAGSSVWPSSAAAPSACSTPAWSRSGASRRDPDGLGDLVGRLEADAPDLAGQAVRLLGDDRAAVVAELLVDPHRQRGRDAVALERRHHLADVALLGPGGGDPTGPDRADARHLGQAARVVVDDLEGGLAEGVHDPPGVDRADALDQAAAEVLLHALERGRQGRAVVGRLELPAVLGVVPPPAAGDDRLAGRQVGQRADHRDQPVVAARRLGLRLGPLGREPRDGEAVLGVLVGDPLDDAAQLAERRRGGCIVAGGCLPSHTTSRGPRAQRSGRASNRGRGAQSRHRLYRVRCRARRGPPRGCVERAWRYLPPRGW